jgi:superfamily II DNA or RNA helicase
LEKLRFRIKGWVSDEEFRELLEFSRYIGRVGGVSVFELDYSKMRGSGYTLKDVYSILSSIEGVVEEDLEAIRSAYLDEVTVYVRFGGDGFLRISSKAYLKSFFEKLGITPPYSPSERAFKVPPYLYAKILLELEKLGFNVVDEVGLLKSSKLPRGLIFNGELRDYQREALEAWERNRFQGVIALPTGSGKTVIAIAGVAKLSVKTLVVVYTKDHVKQWADAFKKFTDAHGMIGVYYGEEKNIAPITITTYQSAFRNTQLFAKHFALIVFDEAHHLPAEKFKHIALHMPSPYRMALSATPEREDGKHVEIFPLIGGVIYHKTASELAEKGYLAPFTVKKVKVRLTGDEWKRYEELRRRFQLLARGRRFQELVEDAKKGDRDAVEALKVHAEMRNIINYSEAKLKAVESIVKEELSKGSKIIVFTQYKGQAEEIASRVKGLLLHGELSESERERVLRAFKTAKTGVLVVTTVGDEGLDIPDANVGILVSGTSSRRQFIQRLGRLLRPKPGKTAVLYEIVTAGTSEEYQARKRKEIL